MTTITRNFPWFIRDLGISIVGERCYTSLVENLNVRDVECIKYSLSKGLGIGIVVGGSIMKIPQILLIVNAGSARGLSFSAYVLETFSYAITLAYSYRNGFPFSTYGENLFLTIQNAIITLLIIAYNPLSKKSLYPKSTNLLMGVITIAASSAVLYSLPSDTLSLLQLCTLPLSLFSKFPQIRQNARAKSTGQLSTFAVVSQIAGCTARLFTNATETGDSLMAAGFALALILNIVLGAQMLMYWGQIGIDLKEKEEKYELRNTEYRSESGRHAPIASPAVYDPAPWQETPVRRVATPPPRTSSASGTRKWSRKVD